MFVDGKYTIITASETQGTECETIECVVNLDAMRIASFGHHVETDQNSIPNNVTIPFEYVSIPGRKYTVAPDGIDADDRFGNGIVRY